MRFDRLLDILCTGDGSLPDINFDFGEAPVVAQAYALIQSRATWIGPEGAYYWSNSANLECPIRFGDNPALAVLYGDADGFHVVFGGLTSASSAPIPDLGVFVAGVGFIALDYRMGPEWNEGAILGLFELMRDLRALSAAVVISHDGNIYESDDGTLLTEFEHWLHASR